jgi:hypothetical protein
MNTLKQGTSPGFDSISSNLLLQISNYVVKPLTHLINLNFEKGIFPTIYKKAIICPIYKAGDERELHNYRPISLISSIAKVIEKCAKCN